MSNAVGADYSHFQPNPDIAGSGDFVFFKATQGLTYQDPTFADRWAEAKAKGKVRGAYHFGENFGGAAQAAYFLAFVTAAGLEPGDLLVLDWEWPTQTPTAMSGEQAADFVTFIQGSRGRRPIVYTGPQFAQSNFAPKAVADCDLWCWQIGSTFDLPDSWSAWKFKQRQSGVPKGDDFNGTKDDLIAYAGGEDDMALNTKELGALAYIYGQKERVKDDKPPADRPTDYEGSDGGNYLAAAQAGYDDKDAEIAARGTGGGAVPDHTHEPGGVTP